MSALLFSAFFPALAAPTYARPTTTVVARNACDQAILISALYDTGGGWRTKGWWVIGPGEHTLETLPVVGPRMYLYVVSNDRRLVWQGDASTGVGAGVDDAMTYEHAFESKTPNATFFPVDLQPDANGIHVQDFWCTTPTVATTTTYTDVTATDASNTCPQPTEAAAAYPEAGPR
jgi:uncharacterized membrane protein